MNRFTKLFLCILLCELVGILGGIFTASSVTSWYPMLIKPSFSPPNYLFGPVWTTLYLLMGISLYMVWNKKGKQKEKRLAIKVFFFQLFLNFLWSFLFFGLHSPILGFICILVLWSAILITIIKFYSLSKPASYLLVPYILWVSFATVLNFFLVLLN